MIWIVLGSTLALIAGTALGFLIHRRLLPAWLAWRALPRETREERRRRRCRAAIAEAEDLLYGKHWHIAGVYARRAYRLDPLNPRAVYLLGLVHARHSRFELALKYLEQAYRAVEHDQPYCDISDSTFLCELAMEASRYCAHLRLDATDPLEKERLAERVLEWAAVAVEKDPEQAASLMDDPVLRELRAQVRLMPAYNEP